MAHPLFDKHRATLDRALTAIAERSYWSAFAESPSPKIYGDGAAEAGREGRWGAEAAATERAARDSRE